MSRARFGGKWADADEDDEEGLDQGTKGNTVFDSAVDEHGVKTRVEYTERDGKTYKVTKKIRARTVQNWTNMSILARKDMEKFGKPKSDPGAEKAHIVKTEETVNIEVSRTPGLAVVKDDGEDKFHEESLKLAEQMTKEKKVWTEMNREKQLDRDMAGVERADDKPAEGGDKPADAAAAVAGGPGRYVPPSLRGKEGGKAGGKGDFSQQPEASLRITNLSEDCKEGDLQDLFGQFGRLARVFIAKDMTTGQSRGFAFVTYHSRSDAERAIEKLNGHGYDNLILQVQFAKPRAQ
jgi:translation initiation factor 3 subunit G